MKVCKETVITERYYGFESIEEMENNLKHLGSEGFYPIEDGYNEPIQNLYIRKFRKID